MTPDLRRHASLVAAIASVTVFGLSIGEAVPLLSLLLEQRGTNAAVTGLNAGAGFVAVIVGPLFTPTLVRRFGIRNLLLGCFALDAATFLSMRVFDGLIAWFILRAALGLIGSTLFTASEAWINLLAEDRVRGRVIGIYAAAMSAGFAFGPLLLSITGIEGWPPFVANTVIVSIAALPLLAIRPAATDTGRRRGANPLRMFFRAPLIVAAVCLFGVYENSLLALLPVWGVRAGLGTDVAAATVSCVYGGAIALQIPIGWISDKVRRLNILRGCGAIGTAGALMLLGFGTGGPALFGVLFVWGGVVSSIYPVALGMAGDRFSGADMVAANAAIIMAYGTGALVGPALGGAAMDAWDPQGLIGLFVVLFAGFTAITMVARRAG